MKGKEKIRKSMDREEGNGNEKKGKKEDQCRLKEGKIDRKIREKGGRNREAEDFEDFLSSVIWISAFLLKFCRCD